MSDSARHNLSYVAEVSYGTTPTTPALKRLRHTACSLAMTKGTLMSEELRQDRQISDFRHGGKQTGGDITGELSYSSYDDLLEAVLGGTWGAKAAPYVASTISAAAADNSINDSASGLPLLEAGDKVTITGFTGVSTTANGVKFVVASSTAAKMVLVVDTAHPALINDAAGEAVTITTITNRLIAGTTRRSFSFQRQYADVTTGGTKGYHLFKGVELNTLALTISPTALVKLVFGTLGQDLAVSDSDIAGATYTALDTNHKFDAFTGTILENGVAIATITELSINAENGLAPRFVVGDDNTQRPAIGRSNVSGQLSAYFETSALLEKFINQTESSLSFLLTDVDGNGYRFKLPRIKYTGGDAPTQGNGPISTGLPFQALLDNTSGTNIAIDRIPA